jgi:ribosomal protein S18 acetylase RimI-like enzyme
MRVMKLDEAHLDDAADLLTRAFFDYSVWTWLAPAEAHRRELMPWFMRMLLRYGLLSGETYVAGDPIVGVAMWEPPERLDADLDDDAEVDAKTGWNELPQRMGDAAMARFNAMIETQRPVRDRISAGSPVWYLPWLGVDPAAQRSGVGAALLRDMFARADADGVPCMLETEKEANVPYYEQHGFAVAASGTLPLDGPRFWTMRRAAPAV